MHYSANTPQGSQHLLRLPGGDEDVSPGEHSTTSRVLIPPGKPGVVTPRGGTRAFAATSWRGAQPLSVCASRSRNFAIPGKCVARQPGEEQPVGCRVEPIARTPP